MDAIKRNRLLMWIAIILLSGNIVMVSAILINGNFKKNDKTERYRDGKRGEFESRMASELNLDLNQIEKYKELKKAHRLKMIPLQDSIKKTKWMIHQELLKKEVDRNYINQLSDSIGQLNAEFEKLNYNHFLELKQQLREEQLVDFKKFMERLPYAKEPYHRRMSEEFKHRD